MSQLEKEKARSVIYRWKAGRYRFDADVIETDYELSTLPDTPDEIGALLRWRHGPYQRSDPVAIIEYPNRAAFHSRDGKGWRLELDGTGYYAQDILSGGASQVLVLWASKKDEGMFLDRLREFRE